MATVCSKALSVRQAVPEDEPFLSQLHARAAAQPQVYPNTSHHIIEQTEQVFGKPQTRAIGRLLTARPDGAEIRLLDLALLPEHCGQGIGGALLQWLQAEAQHSGKAVRLHVAPGQRARRWYERHGFYPLEERGADGLLEWRAADART